MLSPTGVLYPGGFVDDRLIADVDWATGIVRVHRTFREWDDLMRADRSTMREDELFVLESISHEFIHVLQLTTTGYCYELSRKCADQVALAIRDHGDLDGVLRSRGEYTAALEPAMAALARQGDREVRAIDILESAAFLCQKRIHRPDMGPREYEEKLNSEASDAAYRRAYDVAVEILQEDAFDQFAHVAALSLMASEPETVFVPIAKAFREHASRLDIARNHRLGLELLDQCFGGLVLGHPIELLHQGRVHPLLKGTVVGIDDLAAAGKVDPMVLMARPYSISQETANVLAGPMLFPPDGDGATVFIPAAWAKRTQSGTSLDGQHLVFLSAVSQLIIMDIEPVPFEPPVSRTPTATQDGPVVARAMSTSRENRTEGTADRFASALGQVECDPAAIRRLRGTIALTFPDDEFNGSPYLEPGVRAYLRGLHDRVPHLLYYLTDVDVAGSLDGCALAYAPAEAVHEAPDGGYALEMDMRTIPALTAHVRSAAAFAKASGDDPLLLIGHLHRCDDALREHLTAVILNPDGPGEYQG